MSSLKMMRQRAFWTLCSLAMLDLLMELGKILDVYLSVSKFKVTPKDVYSKGEIVAMM